MPPHNKNESSPPSTSFSSLKHFRNESDYGSVSPSTERTESATDDKNDYRSSIDGGLECSVSDEAKKAKMIQTLAGVAGNVLEWYDFAVFGYFGDVLGDVFFPANQPGNAAIVESYAVFGGAFLARPLGGLLMGYIGDTYGSKHALVLSIFLMAFPTFVMGCLPSYESIGPPAIILLIIVRLMQGLSVGGQLVSSLVFTLENHPKSQWGFYGSFVMATANFGTLLGGISAFSIRALLTEEQLYSWGWRIPFLLGIVVSISGFYLKSHSGHEEHDAIDSKVKNQVNLKDRLTTETEAPIEENPLRLLISPDNIRQLVACCMIPMMWSSGFYTSFVWMAIYMTELIERPVPAAFAVNSVALFLSVCLLFPIAGVLSDSYGRKYIMTIGGLGLCILSPMLVMLIGQGYASLAFIAQMILGISLSFWGAPMMAWMMEAFDPKVRLTSIATGFNVAQATVGAITPALATYLVDNYTPYAPGYMLTAVACIALCGLRLIAPEETRDQDEYDSLPTQDSESESSSDDEIV